MRQRANQQKAQKRTGRGAPDADRFTNEKRQRFLELYGSKATSVRRAAKEIGVSTVTIFNHVRSDPEFAKAFEQALSRNTDHAEDLLMEHVLDKNQGGNLIALFGLLKARKPEKYRDNVKLEHSGTILTKAEDLAAARSRVQQVAEQPGALN